MSISSMTGEECCNASFNAVAKQIYFTIAGHLKWVCLCILPQHDAENCPKSNTNVLPNVSSV